MAAHDTDPENTLPNAPDGAAGEDASVESLLADLARAPLPVEGVNSTDGHMAASVAVAAHRPPRAMRVTAAAVDAHDMPAVVVNTTQPMGAPARAEAASPIAGVTTRMPLARDTVVDAPEDRTRGAASYTTTPSARVRSTQRTYLAVVAGIVVAIGIAVPLFFLGRTTAPVDRAEGDVSSRVASSAPLLAATGSGTAAVVAASSTVVGTSPATAAVSTALQQPGPAETSIGASTKTALRQGGHAPGIATTSPPAPTSQPAPPAPVSPSATTTKPAPASSGGDFPWRQ